MRALLLALSLAAAPADPWFGVDKAAHAGVSFVATSATYIILENDLGVAPAWKRALVAGGLTLTAGAIKEVAWDLGTHGGDPSWRDFTWDAVGTAVGTGLCLLIDHLVHR